MSASKLDFGKMVGPLPVGAWIGAGVAGIGAGVYLNMKRKSAAAASSAGGASVLDTTALGPKGTVAVVPNGGILLPNGAQPTSGAGNNTDTSAVRPTDNQQWSQLVLTTLLASGYQSGAVSSALADYLGGQALSPQERALIDLAIAKVGLPPNPVPLAPQPTPVTPPPVATQRVGPAYPAEAQPFSFDVCPAGRTLVAGATGWTCATDAERKTLTAFLKAYG